MLVISRFLEEAFSITPPDGRSIVVRVVKIQGDKVRLSIDAPRDNIVSRPEDRSFVGSRSVPEAVT